MQLLQWCLLNSMSFNHYLDDKNSHDKYTGPDRKFIYLAVPLRVDGFIGAGAGIIGDVGLADRMVGASKRVHDLNNADNSSEISDPEPWKIVIDCVFFAVRKVKRR